MTHRVEEEVGMGGSSAIAGACCKMVPIGCVAWREKKTNVSFSSNIAVRGNVTLAGRVLKELSRGEAGESFGRQV